MTQRVTRYKRAACYVFAALLWGSPLSIQAQQADGDAITQSLSGAPGDASRGRTIVLSRQTGLCILCHSGPFPEEKFQGNLAPDLAVSAAGLNEAQLRARLVDARLFKPDTIMPSYFKKDHGTRVAPQFADKTLLTAQDIEDVVAFLVSLKQ